MIDNRLKHQQEQNPGQRYADIHSGLPDADIFNISLSAEDSQKIMKLCEERNLSIFAVLSMGVRTGLSCFNDNQEDVSFKMIINRRGTIAEKKSGGIKINILPTMCNPNGALPVHSRTDPRLPLLWADVPTMEPEVA